MINSNGQGNAPYVPDPVISGNVGVQAATLSYPGGSTTTDWIGSYPSKFLAWLVWHGDSLQERLHLLANQQELHQCNPDQAYQNYTAIPLYSISGNTGVVGVTLSYTDNTPRTVTSQPSGSYSFTVPSSWGGMVTPTHPCFTFSPDSREYISINANRTTENYTPSFNSGAGCSDITVQIGGANQGRFGLEPGASTRASFTGVNNGPVQIASTNGIPLIGAERLIYKVNNVNTSFTEMMGLPDSQVDNTYARPGITTSTLIHNCVLPTSQALLPP